MGYTVYAISSLSRNYIYVGMTSQIQQRIQRHNSGRNKTTSPYRPFKIIYSKYFNTRINARKHEIYLKSGSGKEFLKKLIDN